MKQKIRENKNLYLLLLGAFLFRCIFAYFYKGFLSDVACFVGWSNRVYEVGFADFYSPEVFSDYPPGYMYILYVIGAILQTFHIEYLSGTCILLVKLPAILCDIISGYLIYRIAGKHFTTKMALFLSGVYLFNPAIFINSSIWGQVDSIFTMIVLLVCLLLTEGRTIPAYFVFAIGILIKPQTLVFAPLILFGIYEHVFYKDFNWKKFFKNLLCGLGAIALIVVLALPFGLETVLSQYTSTLGSYPYIAVNAYNFWGLLGKNWASQEEAFLFMTYKELGTIVIIALTLLSAVLFVRKIKSAERYFLAGSFLIITMFLFSVRMHERYLFPGLLLLLCTYAVSKKKNYFHIYLLISLSHFLNIWHVLYYYDPQNYNAKADSILLISLLMVVSGGLYYVTIFRDLQGKLKIEDTSPNTNTATATLTATDKTPTLSKLFGPKPPVRSRTPLPFTALDWGFMLGITLLYACISFHQLGITATPTTEYTVPLNTYLDITSEDNRQISTLSWYLMNEQDITFSLEVKSDTEETWTKVQDVEMKSVFSWGSVTLPQSADNVRITNTTEDATIAEIVIQDVNGNILPVQNASWYPTLFDEADLLPERIDHLSTAIFDEIYYTRTAYEFINGLPTYENTHPPFGKCLIALGASLLGTTPFGFRFMGAFLGVLMLPFLYLLGRNITRNRYLGAFITFLFAFDFMHFTQTRITTIDVFVTFFIIMMYYFMERYINLSFYDLPLKKTWLPLGACGIAFGFGVASKWTGAYAGVGLAIIFFSHLFLRYREYRYATEAPTGNTDGIPHSHIIQTYKKNALGTIGFCLIFFVAIPFCIYLLSYIPFVDSYRPGLLERMLQNQETMFSYHSALEATHPYSSTWYEWPTMARPILYYSNQLTTELCQGISAFGNPLVWWAGIPAFIYMIYLAFKEQKKDAAFLCVAYLAQYLPWALVSRCTFIYHYFPSVPFVALMIGYSFLQLQKRVKPKIFYGLLIGYAGAVFILFAMFYPMLSGTPVDANFVEKYLRWNEDWVLIIRNWM